MLSVRPLVVAAISLAAPPAVAQEVSSLIIDGDSLQQVQGRIDTDSVTIRDSGRLELVGGFADLENGFTELLLEDDATADVRFGLSDRPAIITTSGRSQFDLTGTEFGSSGINSIGPFFGSLRVEGFSQARVTNGRLGLGATEITDNGALTANRVRLGSEDGVRVSDSGILIAIDSSVTPIFASGDARVELLGGGFSGVANFSPHAFSGRSSVLVDGFAMGSNTQVGHEFSFGGQSTGVFRGDTRITSTGFIRVGSEADVRVEGGTYSVPANSFLSAFSPSGFDVSGSGQLTFTGGTVRAEPRPSDFPSALFRAVDDGVLTFEDIDFIDDPEVLARFTVVASDPTAVFTGPQEPGARTFGDPIQTPAVSLFDESQLVLLADEVTINGEVFGIGDADELTLAEELPELGVLSAVLASGQLFEASFVRELGTTITLRSADGTAGPNVVPIPTALAGGLLLAAGLFRRRDAGHVG